MSASDILVVGAGPVGLACAIEAARAELSAVVVEKGGLVNSLLRYPVRMEFFSTPELVEIGEHAFPTSGYKPVREEAIEYYRRVAEIERLDIRLYERVLRVEGERGNFRVVTDKGIHPAKHVVVAIGFFDKPNMMNVPGEDLPKVTHYYREAYPYSLQRVAVIGAKNSAAKAALDCYRHGAEVTLICRQPALSEKIKYWIRPDLENRIKEGNIRALFNTSVEEIQEKTVIVRTPEGREAMENDWVLAMTGYHPDYTFLEALQIAIGDEPDCTPLVDDATFETSRPGIYMAGTVCGGYNTSRWFIENGRFHARQIIKHIAGGEVEAFDFSKKRWKTEE